MGLLDKAKEKKLEDGAVASEADAIEETGTTEEKKADGAPKKKMVKKKKVEAPSGKMKFGKKPSLRKSSPGIKKKPVKKKVAIPKREKVVKEPEEPTIEGLPEDLMFASFTPRLIAAIIDWALLAFVCFIIFIVLFLAIEEAGMAVALVTSIFIPILYFLYMEGTTGQTFGKRMMYVKVISLDGKPLNPKRYMKAALWKGFPIPMLIPIPIISIIDALLGLLHSHKETRQRISQYNEDLIVIAVEKKKVKFGYGMDEEQDDEGSEEVTSEDGSAEDEGAEESTSEEETDEQ